jgi:hypothetical protein
LLGQTLNHRVESSKLIQITPLQTPLISSLNLYLIPAIEIAAVFSPISHNDPVYSF